jgi:drug/metabolite transporter superfamily protein YnfA
MSRLLLVGVLFVLAGLCEIGGGYLVWGWMRDNKPLLWALVGAVVLAFYGVVAALQPISEFGRVYAAYGGIFIALSLGRLRGWLSARPLRSTRCPDLHCRHGSNGRPDQRLRAATMPVAQSAPCPFRFVHRSADQEVGAFAGS